MDTGDRTPPALRALKVRRGKRALRVRFALSEGATVRVVVRRKGAEQPVKVKTVRRAAGKRTVRLRTGKLRKGRYTITVVATDAAGNASPVKARTLVRRR